MAVSTQGVDSSSKKLPFSRKQVRLAISALLSHLSKKLSEEKKKDELFEHDEYLWLMLGVHKIPTVKKTPKKIALPHSFNDSSEVCLISKEPGKVVKAALQGKGVVSINKVISLTKLRKEYKTYQLKRQLLSSYGVFLCDDRIYHLVCKTLGKEFFKRKREPLPVNLTYSDLKTEIQKSLSCTLLRMGHGPSSAIKIGSVNIHNEKELLANAIHAMKIIANKVPGGWKNIKCFYLKTATSIALPLYQSLQFTSEKKTKAKEPLDKTAIVTKKEDGNAEKLKMKSSKVKRRGSVK